MQLKEVATPEFKLYAQQVIKNSQALGNYLMSKGYTLATNGTDNHLILWDLRPQKLTGNKFEALCDDVHITLNKNAICGDVSAFAPGGVRVGACALTSRGMLENDFEAVGEFLHRALVIALDLQTKLAASAEKGKGVTVAAFKGAFAGHKELTQLKLDVNTFSKKFFMPGFHVDRA